MATFTTGAPIALITGANRGIGIGLARELKKLGYNVIGTARNVAPESTEELRKVAYAVVQLDTSQSESISKLVPQLEKLNVTHIHCLVNNAGIFDGVPFDKVTADIFADTFATNATGPFLITRALMPMLRAAAAEGKHQAMVVQVSSTLGSIQLNQNNEFQMPVAYAYRASKAALNQVNRSLAAILEKDKVACVAVCPGHTQTEGSGFAGQYTLEESTGKVSKLIQNFGMKDTGKFYYLEGNEQPW
ncbi:hypothetical protein RI367_008393 [Sorochytrium milnesiophthora]